MLKIAWKSMKNIDIKERQERAENYFKSGYNCAQAVVMAFDDVMEMTADQLARLAAPFGGGIGRMREVCGTVSGMAFVAGAIVPSNDPANLEERKQNYALVQHFAEQFRQHNGNIVCRSLLGLDRPKDEPTPSPRTAEYYKKRPCAEYVYDAALIVGKYLEK